MLGLSIDVPKNLLHIN